MHKKIGLSILGQIALEKNPKWGKPVREYFYFLQNEIALQYNYEHKHYLSQPENQFFSPRTVQDYLKICANPSRKAC